jgi:hypothetical protein
MRIVNNKNNLNFGKLIARDNIVENLKLKVNYFSNFNLVEILKGRKY